MSQALTPAVHRVRFALAVSLLLLVLGASPPEAPARTYARPQPDPWYTITVEFDPRSFPPGVTIREREVRLPFYQGTERRGSLHNDGPTPLHLVRTLSSPLDWLGRIPPNEVAVRKVLLGKGHRIDFEKDVANRGRCRFCHLAVIALRAVLASSRRPRSFSSS